LASKDQDRLPSLFKIAAPNHCHIKIDILEKAEFFVIGEIVAEIIPDAYCQHLNKGAEGVAVSFFLQPLNRTDYRQEK